jgi:hypothetical protein
VVVRDLPFVVFVNVNETVASLDLGAVITHGELVRSHSHQRPEPTLLRR